MAGDGTIWFLGVKKDEKGQLRIFEVSPRKVARIQKVDMYNST